jgi:tetratricopeptide (TPR) repeat protein
MAAVVEREPKNGDAYVLWARALRLAGRHDEAKATLEKARPFEPDGEDVAVEAALLDPEAGLAHLVSLAKEDADWTRALGDAYAESGRGALARAAYDRWLAENPDDVEVLVRRCRCR